MSSFESDLTPGVATRLRWLLDLLRGPGTASLTADMVRGGLGSVSLAADPRGFLVQLAWWRQRVGTFEAAGPTIGADGMIELALRDVRNRPWILRCRIECEPPHRLLVWALSRPLPFGVTIRAASPEEFAALGHLEFQSPVVHEDGTRVTTDRRNCFADYLNLMGHVQVYVAEQGSKIVAADPNGFMEAQIAGQPWTLVCRYNTCILPSHQGHGLNDALVAEHYKFLHAQDEVAATCVYVDPGNYRIVQWSPIPTWRCRPFRALLSCDDLAGQSSGRIADRSDTARLCDLFNACHGREQLFVLYDEARLVTRFSRIPGYSWSTTWIAEDAAVGVWCSGEREIRETPGGERLELALAIVLDYGFIPQRGLSSLEQVLRSVCRALTNRGITHLAIASSDPSPASGLFRRLTTTVDYYDFGCHVPEPSETAVHGIYADQVYF